MKWNFFRQKYSTHKRVVYGNLSEAVPVSTRGGQKDTETVQVKRKSCREPNAASEPLKARDMPVPGLDFKQLQTHFKLAVTLAFSTHNKATLGLRLCCIANVCTEY